jgi:sugar phosphate isomerase/epimerase
MKGQRFFYERKVNMKISLYSITYSGIWYQGPALSFEEFVKRAKSYGYAGIELDGKRPMGCPLDLNQAAREKMRAILDREGMEISCLAGNNDFSSPIPELRECQLLMVREQARLAADLGAKVVRLFAAWPGVVIRDGIATYDLVRNEYYPFERQYPFATRIERWNFVRDCLKEAACYGEEFGVVMALQNHHPLINNWKDCYDLVQEVGSPWLQFCLDLPNMHDYTNPNAVREAVQAVKGAQVHTHFGGEFFRDDAGRVQARPWGYGSPAPDFGYFVKMLREIDYTGYLSYELCHPLLDERHRPQGLEYVDSQAQLAIEYMQDILRA